METRSLAHSTLSLKRKSGEFDPSDENDENVQNKSNVSNTTKKLKTSEPPTPSGKAVTLSKTTTTVKSSLPRYTVPRRTASTNNTSVTTTATSTVTISASSAVANVAVSSNPTTTPRKGTRAEKAQTPGQKAKDTRIPNLEIMVQEALSEITFSSIKGKLESVFTSNNEKLSSISNSLKAKSKDKWDTKEKMKRQENAIKDFKDVVTSVNEEVQNVMDTCDNVDKKITSVITKSLQQRHEDLILIAGLKEKEVELQRVKEAIAEERGNFKTSLLEMQIQYDDKIHKLESAQLSQSKELEAKEKELLQLDMQLNQLKRDYDTAIKESSANAEQVSINIYYY
jgi:hypothetical protein